MANIVVEGVAAGLVGALAMTIGEKVEQRLTGRPSSYVPALTLGRLVGVEDQRAESSTALNLGMPFGQAAALGVVRALMAEGGLRGVRASSAFTGLRLVN